MTPMTAGFMDKLVWLKLGHMLYMHNPKLNNAVFFSYFASLGV